ncbi:hypothetical protein ACJX0J_015437, partial [Zea mays]
NKVWDLVGINVYASILLRDINIKFYEWIGDILDIPKIAWAILAVNLLEFLASIYFRIFDTGSLGTCFPYLPGAHIEIYFIYYKIQHNKLD